MTKSQADDPLFRLTGLGPEDLADTLSKNPRAYMALKGAVAEKHLQLYLDGLQRAKKIASFRSGVGDFEKDFYISIPGFGRELVIECKNVQVIQTSTLASKREYLEFLRRNQYLDDSDCSRLLPQGHRDFTAADTNRLKEIFKLLPLDLRESGLPRYAFSRKICGVTSDRSLSPATCHEYLKQFEQHPITIDFQRTRNSRDEGQEDHGADRFYRVGELDIVAACLFSRTLEWQFVFCPAVKLKKHNRYKDRYSNSVEINAVDWKADLLSVIE